MPRFDERPHLHYDGTPIRVPGIGDAPCDIMIVGERPGEEEAYNKVPFVGASGREQDQFLQRNGVHRHQCYLTNLVKTWVGGANPTPEEIREHEGELIGEIGRVRPSVILAVGAHSTRWFLGDVDMDSVHGTPRRSIRDGLKGIVIVPCYHPAYGLRDADAQVLVYYDYKEAAEIIRKVTKGLGVKIVEDEHPTPEYVDGGEDDIRDIIQSGPEVLAHDTEGLRGTEWGFSVSVRPGHGVVFRRRHPEFPRVAQLLREYRSRRGPSLLTVYHNSMWDIEIERALGLGQAHSIYDTMVAAFFLRVEPQALKTLARRHAGMIMRSYEETIGEAAQGKHLDYVYRAGELSWAGDKNPQQLLRENDGTFKVYTPQPLRRTVASIFTDFMEDKRDKDGNPVDLESRWKGIDHTLRRRVESELGPWPIATLDDIPIEDAIWYAGRDPDATLRVLHKLAPMIDAVHLASRLQLDLDIIPIFEEMQSTGIVASRKEFEKLRDDMWEAMDRIGSQLSTYYNDGRPFNPMSQPQVSALAARCNLVGVKKTKTGKVSTAKKSMEHLRHTNQAMGWVYDWREHEKVKDSFAEPILERIPDGVDYYPVRCTIKITRVAQDRISAADPNLTAMPVASKLGRRVRGGFRIPDEVPEVFLTGDMSQIEMRVMADLSRDKFMCQLFNEGRDIHSETCIRIFGLDIVGAMDDAKGEFVYPGLDKNLRNPTKRAGFGIITGIMGPGLYDQLRVMNVDMEKFCKTMGHSDPVQACQALIEDWKKVYPGVKNFLTWCGNEAFAKGYVREEGGFLRYLPGVWSADKYAALEARRQSHSHIISGTAQTMLRRAMLWLKPRIDDLRRETELPVRWLMQIHDEILFQVHEDIAPVVQEMLHEALVKHSGELRVPIGASTAIAKSWGELEK